MSIYEAIGIGYTLLATAVFTAELIYFVIKGLAYAQHLIRRADVEENSDLQEPESIKRELAKSL